MSPVLGSLFRKYLHGSDLKQPVTVKIIMIGLVEVLPHPKAKPVTKGCVWVEGLPTDLPNGILFGPKAEKELVRALGGPLPMDKAAGKVIKIAPLKIKVGTEDRIAITFLPPDPQH